MSQFNSNLLHVDHAASILNMSHVHRIMGERYRAHLCKLPHEQIRKALKLSYFVYLIYQQEYTKLTLLFIFTSMQLINIKINKLLLNFLLQVLLINFFIALGFRQQYSQENNQINAAFYVRMSYQAMLEQTAATLIKIFILLSTVVLLALFSRNKKMNPQDQDGFNALMYYVCEYINAAVAPYVPKFASYNEVEHLEQILFNHLKEKCHDECQFTITTHPVQQRFNQAFKNKYTIGFNVEKPETIHLCDMQVVHEPDFSHYEINCAARLFLPAGRSAKGTDAPIIASRPT